MKEVNNTLERIRLEDNNKKEKEALKLIEQLVTVRRKRPSLEDARIYLEILYEEYPLFRNFSDYELIKLAKEELDVELTPKQFFMLRSNPLSNILYEVTYFD